MAAVTPAKAPKAALRPLAISLSCLNRIPSREATIEYADKTNARASENWPNCAMLALLHACSGFLLILRGAFGLHFIGDKNAVAPKLTFDNGLRAIHKCVGGGIRTNVLNWKRVCF